MMAKYFHPSRHLNRILHRIEKGDRPSSFIPSGAPVMRQMFFSLEKISAHIQDLQGQLNTKTLFTDAILHSMSECTVVVNPSGRIILTNASLHKTFDIQTNPMGRTIIEVLRSHDLHQIALNVLANRVPVDQEITIDALNSLSLHVPRSFRVKASSVQDGKQSFHGVILVISELTPLKISAITHRDFIANTSHELRTPLAVFQGYLETLLDSEDMDWAEARPMLLSLQRHSNRLNNLVKDLLTLTRMESKMLTLTPVTIRPHLLAENAARDFHKTALGKSKKLTIKIDENLPDICVDVMRLEQVFYNLLDNAATYSPKHGSITISARYNEPDKEVVFCVEDQGIGIMPSDLPRIFERFYRADKARNREHGGTGLGLSIVKHIITAHGGKLWAESEQEKWTRIFFTIPIEKEKCCPQSFMQSLPPQKSPCCQDREQSEG